MKLLVFLLLSVLGSIAGAWTINGEWVDEFIWPQDSKDVSQIASIEGLSFSRPYFENFSKTIADQFIKIKWLTFSYGTVKQIYLKPSIEKLEIFRSKTQNIDIDLKEEYAIVRLNLERCGLTRVPSNINHLKRLQTLNIIYNQIEHVEMSDFSGLNNLTHLGLSGNQINTLSSEWTVHLPKLDIIWLIQNKLQEIDVCLWDMPNLKEFNSYHNQLRFVVNLVDQFPKLEKIVISYNPLVCSWKDDLMRSLESKNISQPWGKPTCDATDKSHAPTQCLSVHLLNKLTRQQSFEQAMQNSTAEIEALKEMAKKSNDENQSLKQTVATLTVMAQKSNEQIQSLTDQLTKLHHSIDDLTEGFYRYVLEKDGGER